MIGSMASVWVLGHLPGSEHALYRFTPSAKRACGVGFPGSTRRLADECVKDRMMKA